MAGCIVSRNSNGQITEVRTPNGRASILFDRIASNPHIKDMDKALDVYKNVYSSQFIEEYGDWQTLSPINAQAVELSINKMREAGVSDVDILAIQPFLNTLTNPTVLFYTDTKLSDIEDGEEDILIGANSFADSNDSGFFIIDKVESYNADGMSVSDIQENIIDITSNEYTYTAIRDSIAVYTPNSPEIANISSPNGLMYDTGEPMLFYRSSNGNIFVDFGDALRNSTQGHVEAGFIVSHNIQKATSQQQLNTLTNDVVIYANQYKLNNQDSFREIVKIDTNTNPTTLTGFINRSILNNKLSDKNVYYNGQYYLIGKGEQNSMQRYNSNLVDWDAKVSLGRESSILHEDGRLEISEVNNRTISVPLKDGSGSQTLSKESLTTALENGEFANLDEQYDQMEMVAASLHIEKNGLYPDSSNDVLIRNMTTEERNVRQKLYDIINKLGVSITSIDSYAANYRQKNGIDPSVEALADLTNKIIAFADGSATTENIAEELAHFLMESFADQASINDVIDGVMNTPEWIEHSQRYYQLYGNKYSGDKLDMIVKREVAGKMLARKMVDGFDTPQTTPQEKGLILRMLDGLIQFIEQIRTFFTKDIQSQFNDVLDNIAQITYTKEMLDYFDLSKLEKTDYVMYSATDANTLKVLAANIESLKDSLVKRMKEYRSANNVTAENKLRADIIRIENAINNGENWQAVQVLVSSVDYQVKMFGRLLRHYENLQSESNVDGRTVYMSPSDQQSIRFLYNELSPLLGELVNRVKALEPINSINKDAIMERMRGLTSSISELHGRANRIADFDTLSQVQRIAVDYGVPEDKAENVKKYADNLKKDSNWLFSRYGSLEHSANAIHNVAGVILNHVSLTANMQTINIINPLIKKYADFSVERMRNIIEYDENGKKTGFILSEIDNGKYKRAERDAQLLAYQQIAEEGLLGEDGKNIRFTSAQRAE